MERFTASDANGKTTDPNALAAAQALRVVRDGGKWEYTGSRYIYRGGIFYYACAVGMEIVARRPRITDITIKRLDAEVAKTWIEYAYQVWPELVGYEFWDSEIDFGFTAPMGFFEALDWWNRAGWDLNAIINIIEMSQYKVVTP